MNLDLLAQMKVASETIFVSEAIQENAHNNYYAERRVSNSMLDYVVPLLQGVTPKKKYSPSFAFGTLIHTALLEPRLFSYEKAGNDAMQIYRCVQTFHDTPLFRELLETSLKEVSHYWDWQDVPCKARIDMVSAKYGFIADIKTTSATNSNELSEHVSKYNYDRQLAFYCDAIGINTACIVAISKKTCEPFLYTLTAEQIAKGREKYETLLDLIRKNDLLEKLLDFCTSDKENHANDTERSARSSQSECK
jgi:hypothetical protein